MQHNREPLLRPYGAPGVSPAELYRFDTRGYLRHERFVQQDAVAAIIDLLRGSWVDLKNARGVQRIDDIVEKESSLRELALRIASSAGIYDVINQPFRLIESYALRRTSGSVQPLHNGQSNPNVSSFGASRRAMWRHHTYHDGRLYCMMVKALVYLTDQTSIDDGPFAVVEGSHKANYVFPLESSEMTTERGLDQGSAYPVYTSAGDLILLNEELMHGAYRKGTPGDRIIVAFSYAPSFVSDYKKLPQSAGDLTTVGFCE